MQKDNFFLHNHGLSQNIFYPKKCINYDKPSLRQEVRVEKEEINSGVKETRTDIVKAKEVRPKAKTEVKTGEKDMKTEIGA